MSRTIGRRRLTLRTRRAFTGLGFLAPWIIGILFFFLNPLVLSLRFSFNRLTLEDGYKLTPVGWSNYFDALRTDENYLP